MKDFGEKEMQAMLDTQTASLNKRFESIENTLRPIAEVYSSAQGFSSIFRFIFKSIIVPLSVVIGIFLAARELFGIHK